MVYKNRRKVALSCDHSRGHAAGMFKRVLIASLAFTSVVTPLVTPLASAEPRDGSHDFDFTFGKWTVKIRKLEHPLSGQQKWLEYTGTGTVYPLWDGKAQVEDLELVSPTAGHIAGMAVRMYSPAAHQWSLNWASVKAPMFGPPTVGEFKNGRGEFYDQEEFGGRMILVRAVWSNITKTSAHFEQSFSGDGGKTWEPNWIADQTRLE